MSSDKEKIAEIAKGLTKAQRCGLRSLSACWQAGPYLPEVTGRALGAYRELGLAVRQFGDMGEPEKNTHDEGISVRQSACWWFRLTPLGREVRAHILKEQKASEAAGGGASNG